MNYWFTSDQHYGHKNILNFQKDNRFYTDLDHMRESFIEWNNQNVSNKDIVYNLGDFSFYPFEETLAILKRLKGKQILILGNHDKGIESRISDFIGDGKFYEISQKGYLRLNKQKFILDHFPLRSWESMRGGSIHLHGHCHGTMPPLGKSVDIGVDSKFITGKHENRPYHIDEIIKFMDGRESLDERYA